MNTSITESRPHHARPSASRVGYDEARGRIENGDVLLFQGTGWLSRLIRWGSKSPYSHAGLALWWNNRLMVIQSAARGVEVLPARTAVQKYDGQVDWWQPDPATRAELKVDILIHAAFDQLGKPFAVWPLIALMARMLRGEELGNPDSRRMPNYFCSQLVSKCYRRAGIDLVKEKADHDTSPGDLARCGRLLLRGVLHKDPTGVPFALPALSATQDAAAALQHAAQVGTPPAAELPPGAMEPPAAEQPPSAQRRS